MALLNVVAWILDALSLLIIVDVLASWVAPDPTSFPRKLTRPLVEPMYAPIHAILGRGQLGGLDFTPMIMMILLQFLANTLRSNAGL